MNKIKYQYYTPEFKDRVIDILQYIWNFPYEEKLEYFKWKYEDNPFVNRILGFIALEGNKVVAFRGYMALPIKRNNQMWLTVQMGDSVTNPEFRRRGIYQELIKYSLNELEKDKRIIVSMNTSSGGRTMNNCLKLGWKPLCERKHFFHFTFWGILYRVLSKRSRWKSSVKTFGDYIIDFSDKMEYELIRQLPDKSDRITHSREKKFYDWRFQNPHNKFRFVYLKDNNRKILAYVALADVGANRYDLVDFNYLDKSYLKIIIESIDKYIEPFFILHWTVGQYNDLFRNHNYFGFYSLDFILGRLKKFNKPPFMVKPINAGSEMKLEQIETWDLYKIIADEI